MSEARWDNAKRLGPAAALDRIRAARDWVSAYEGLWAASAHPSDKVFLRQIAAEVSNPTQGRLTGTAGLIIWERIRSGDILFEGKGLVVEDDLFRVAGRANWTLRTLLQKNFGIVKPDSTQSKLDALRQRWERYLEGKAVSEEPPAYPSKVKRLPELRSPAAVGALIQALAPRREKDALDATCLKTLYGLDEMPTAPGSSARLCNPDLLTHRFLAAITDVAGQQSADWWQSWWKRHGNALRWDPDRAKFVTSAP
jgi:hypothetical protein